MTHETNRKEFVLAAVKRDPELTSYQLAQRFGLSDSVVRRWVKEAGLKLPNANDGLSLIIKPSRNRRRRNEKS